MGPMIREEDSERVAGWVSEAAGAGARVLAGGSRNGQLFEPTLVADVSPEMRISHDEIFGPVVGVTNAPDIDAAIAAANDTQLRPERRHLHPERGLGDEVRARVRVGQPARELGHPVARRPDAVRRRQGERHGQGRSQVRGAGDDRDQDGGCFTCRSSVRRPRRGR